MREIICSIKNAQVGIYQSRYGLSYTVNGLWVLKVVECDSEHDEDEKGEVTTIYLYAKTPLKMQSVDWDDPIIVLNNIDVYICDFKQ